MASRLSESKLVGADSPKAVRTQRKAVSTDAHCYGVVVTCTVMGKEIIKLDYNPNNYKALDSWFNNVQIWNAEMLLLPVHLEESEHYLACVVSPLSKKIIFFDSLLTNELELKAIGKQFFFSYKHFAKFKIQKNIGDFKDWSITVATCCP